MKISMEQRRRRDGGQITIFVGLALGIFLLAFIGFATDYTNFWLHRQQAQSGADATCQAAATDLYLYAIGQATPTMNFVPTLNGTISCSAAPTAAPCIIAKYNGFDTAIADNDVKMSFPAGPPGAPPPPDNIAIPYVQVDVTQQVQAYFSRLLTGTNKTPVHAKAVCGLVSTPGPVPIVVLHPTDDTTLNMRGRTDTIRIVGGPPQSVQINSSSTSAVTAGSLATVDLSRGGPNNTGSSFGTFGGQATLPGGVDLGSTGHWLYPHLPIPDPYASVSAPTNPGPPTGTSPFSVVFGVDGCPDPNGCDEFLPGAYADGICVKSGSGGCGGGTKGPKLTAIFQPGVYYLGGVGLKLAAQSTVRVTCCGGRADGDGTGGVMFYFSGDQNTSIYIDSNSGASPACDGGLRPNGCVVQYHKDGSTESGVQSRALQCPGGQAPPPEVPATLPGNVFMAPCSGTYGDPSPRHYRGFLYFQDRAVAVDGSGGGQRGPQWQGGGSTLAAGFMYFHQCRAGDHTGTGTCTAFGDTFSMGGTPGSGSYAVGSLVTDKIHSNGTPDLTMILHPDNLFSQLKIVFFE
jgi:putative Flp pilus-assembly TadE/G-like protein